MAKGLQQRRGKVGNEIYYNDANSNNKEKQGVRTYQPNVKNPKSVAQCIQRMKTAPSVAFYRALAELLDHSWQGIPYGGRSTQHFRKLAMLMKEGYPYVLKGDNTPYPGEYQISSGSLVSPVISSWDATNRTLNTSLMVSDTGLYQASLDRSTLGEIAFDLIKSNSFLQNGDQLTFIYCLPVAKKAATEDPDLSNGVYYKYARLILNIDSEYKFSDWVKESHFDFATYGDDPHYLGFTGGTKAGIAADGMPCGGAIILSRPPRNEGGSWQRSLTKFFCTPEYLNIMMSDAAYQAALESYQKETSSLSSDWYLNQGGENSDSTNLGGSYISSGSVTINGTTFNGAFFNRNKSSKLIVGPLASGSRNVYRFIDATTVAVQGAFTDDQVKAAVGNSYTLYQTAKNYVPDLTEQESGGDDERP